MDINWEKEINALRGPFPEKGADPPPEETIQKDVAKMLGNITRITLDIFIFDNDDLEQAYMVQNEALKVYQGATYRDFIELSSKGKRKKS